MKFNRSFSRRFAFGLSLLVLGTSLEGMAGNQDSSSEVLSPFPHEILTNDPGTSHSVMDQHPVLNPSNLEMMTEYLGTINAGISNSDVDWQTLNSQIDRVNFNLSTDTPVFNRVMDNTTVLMTGAFGFYGMGVLGQVIGNVLKQEVGNLIEDIYHYKRDAKNFSDFLVAQDQYRSSRSKIQIEEEKIESRLNVMYLQRKLGGREKFITRLESLIIQWETQLDLIKDIFRKVHSPLSPAHTLDENRLGILRDVAGRTKDAIERHTHLVEYLRATSDEKNCRMLEDGLEVLLNEERVLQHSCARLLDPHSQEEYLERNWITFKEDLALTAQQNNAAALKELKKREEDGVKGIYEERIFQDPSLKEVVEKAYHECLMDTVHVLDARSAVTFANWFYKGKPIQECRETVTHPDSHYAKKYGYAAGIKGLYEEMRKNLEDLQSCQSVRGSRCMTLDDFAQEAREFQKGFTRMITAVRETQEASVERRRKRVEYSRLIAEACSQFSR